MMLVTAGISPNVMNDIVGLERRHQGLNPADAHGVARTLLSDVAGSSASLTTKNITHGVIGHGPDSQEHYLADVSSAAHEPLGEECELCSSSPDVECGHRLFDGTTYC
ncbi:unnamed protein product [Peronospora belbahrii]|uniref:Uncharacterized protein n=1 Tax=Peronospora belbahrii TaxID=622444 RepID=A0ABN8DER0_9STRA|nr:unnamed protein product [Peronospora belbahrii]